MILAETAHPVPVWLAADDVFAENGVTRFILCLVTSIAERNEKQGEKQGELIVYSACSFNPPNVMVYVDIGAFATDKKKRFQSIL